MDNFLKEVGGLVLAFVVIVSVSAGMIFSYDYVKSQGFKAGYESAFEQIDNSEAFDVQLLDDGTREVSTAKKGI